MKKFDEETRKSVTRVINSLRMAKSTFLDMGDKAFADLSSSLESALSAALDGKPITVEQKKSIENAPTILSEIDEGLEKAKPAGTVKQATIGNVHAYIKSARESWGALSLATLREMTSNVQAPVEGNSPVAMIRKAGTPQAPAPSPRQDPGTKIIPAGVSQLIKTISETKQRG